MVETHNASKARYESEISEYKSKALSLQQQLSLLMEAIDQQEGANAQSGDEYKTLSHSLAQENAKLTAKMEEYQQLQQTQMDATMEENRKLKAMIDEMKAKNQRNEEDHHHQMTDIVTLKSQINELQNQLNSQQTSYAGSLAGSNPDINNINGMNQNGMNGHLHSPHMMGLGNPKMVYFSDNVHYGSDDGTVHMRADSDIDSMALEDYGSPDATVNHHVIKSFSPRVSATVADLMMSTQNATHTEDVKQMVFKRYQTLRHIDEMTDDDDSQSNTKGGYGTGKESEFETDTETDEEERAEIKKRVSMRDERLATQVEEAAVRTQLAHLQVGTYGVMKQQMVSYQNWISTDEQTAEEPDKPKESSPSPSSGMIAPLSGDESGMSSTPMDTPKMMQTHSLITKETAKELSAAELKRQKREMQEHMALLVASHSLPREGNGSLRDIYSTSISPSSPVLSAFPGNR